MSHILFVDGNSLMHANHNGTVLTVGGMQVQAVFGMLKSLKSLMDNTPGDAKLIVAWDGRAQFRLDLLPEYKGNRAPLDDKQAAHKAAFRLQAPFVEKSLSLLGISQLRSPLLEADDLAGHLVPRLVAAGHRVTMVTGDKDWLQLVGPSVTWFDPIRDRRVTPVNFFEFTGYVDTDAFTEGKALVGDISDNISGVGGIGKTGAPLFMAKWKSVDSFFQAVDDGRAGKLTKAHQHLASPEGRAAFERNVKLMDWRHSRKPLSGEVLSTPALVDVPNFERFCERLTFASILRDLSAFLKSFNINYTKELA